MMSLKIITAAYFLRLILFNYYTNTLLKSQNNLNSVLNFIYHMSLKYRFIDELMSKGQKWDLFE